MLWKKNLLPLLALYLILGTWKGYLALFEKGEEEPIQIFPCTVNTLPDADQQALEQGIPVRNPSILQQLLEDYLS